MELTIRDWMVVIGVLLIVAVLLDAWRRVRNDRYAQVDMNLVDPALLPAETDDDIAWLKELPNGGARVITLPPSQGDGHGSDSPHSAADTDGEPLLGGFSAQGSADEQDSMDWLEGIEEPAPEVPAADREQSLTL